MRITVLYPRQNLKVQLGGFQPADLMAALAQGLSRCGYKTHNLHVAGASPGQLCNHLDKPDVVVCWGWKVGAIVASHLPLNRILVLERGYMTDNTGADRFQLSSLAWGGLNGRGTFCGEDDGGDRWKAKYTALEPVIRKRKIALLCGQVRGDASLRSATNIDSWYVTTAQELSARGFKVVFRPHPLHSGAAYSVPADEVSWGGILWMI